MKDLNKGGTWQTVKRIKNWDRNNKTIQRAHEVLNALLGWMLVILMCIGVYYL